MVRMSDTACSVEAFQLVREAGKPARLCLEGWFVSSAPVQAIQLVVPGAPAHSMAVGDFRRPSGGLVGLYGERARRARFKFEETLDTVPDGLAQAQMVILMANADISAIAIGPMLVESEGLPPFAYTEADRAMLARFESLGDNCEFGLVQRAVGVDRLGLLRLAGAREPGALADAIGNDFEGFADPDDLALSTFGSEWIVSSRRYGFTFHTGVGTDAMTSGEILVAQSRTLVFMAQKLVEDIKGGEKIFLRRVDEGDVADGMRPIHQALRAKGDATLLWVTAATPEHAHARVECLGHGLFRAYHGELADYETAHLVRPDPWIELLRAAERALAEPPAEAASEPAPWWPATPPVVTRKPKWWRLGSIRA